LKIVKLPDALLARAQVVDRDMDHEAKGSISHEMATSRLLEVFNSPFFFIL